MSKNPSTSGPLHVGMTASLQGHFILDKTNGSTRYKNTVFYDEIETEPCGAQIKRLRGHMSNRTATTERNTLETQIKATIDLDGSGECSLYTDLPFLEHMLEQVAKHGQIDLQIRADGDLHIDAHHTVEDIGISLGQAFSTALGDKQGVTRYGHAYVPLDEALSRVVVDFSGRPSLEFHVEFPRSTIGDFDTELFYEFFQGFVNHAGVTLHIDNLRGRNSHHIAETIFKAFGRALRIAVAIDPRLGKQIPSTKGTL